MRRAGSLLPAVAVSLALIVGLAACAGAPQGSGAAVSSGAEDAKGADAPAPSPVTVRVASLKGPTSIGLVSFMEQAKQNGSGLVNSYDFTVAGTADAIVPDIVRGETDIALVPANIASVLYARTGGGVQVLGVNTLGVLYVVSADSTVTSLDSLAGRTVLMTGKGNTPEYVMAYLLDAAGLAGSVRLEYKSEATELAAALVADPTAVAVLPEPYVSSVCAKSPEVSVRLSLTDEWDRLQGAAVGTGSDAGAGKLVTGVTVARKEFVAANPHAVAEFLAAQQASVDTVTANPAAASELVVAAGIIDNASVAAAAIPRCNLVCMTGAEAREALDGYLAVLFAHDPASVGGALPLGDFYYSGE
jgi:NitT/TauT family transport system substrate-binding protein